MIYKNALDYIFSMLPMYHRIGPAAYKADMGNTAILLQILDNPQNKFKTIHIAGTNGKGSVSHILASIIQEAGLKTGLYTSPHLIDFRERIKINGKKIPKSKVIHFIKNNIKFFDTVKPSFFEMTVALAFHFFAEQNVDIAIIETGLGGRLDSTNIITPVVSVITNISYDHQYLLGNSLQEIAQEKAGIIKNNVPVIVGETQAEVMSVFKHKAEEQHAELFFADQLFNLDTYKNNFPKSNYAYFEIIDINTQKIYNILCPLLGFYQKKNIITALCTIKKINSCGLKIMNKHIEDGFKNVFINTKLKGRWHIIRKKPLTVCDTAHNEAGIHEVTQQFKSLPFKKLHIVFGCVEDKDLSAVLTLLPQNALYYFCTPDIPRGLNVNTLIKLASEFNLKGAAYSSVAEAFEAANNNAAKEDMIFVGGSTFVVAEIM